MITSWNNYFEALHDLDILVMGTLRNNYEGSPWFLLTALKSENSTLPAIGESSVCVLADIPNWSSDDAIICAIVQLETYFPYTNNQNNAIFFNHYEVNIVRHKFEKSDDTYNHLRLKDINNYDN